MPVTINQIAELAGVSKGTVDRVLNNRGNVSKDIEARVRQIAKELNYKPNLMAKSLALRKKAPKIGVVFHVKNNFFIEQVKLGVQAATEELVDYGITVISYYSRNFDVDDQLALIDRLLEEGVSALAITPINEQPVIDRIDGLIDQNFPVFCFINDIKTRNPHIFVGIDAYQTGGITAGLFNMISRGEEKLAIVSPGMKMLGHVQRIEGLKDTLHRWYPQITMAGVCEIPSNDIEIYKTVKQFFQEHQEITSLWYATSLSNGGIVALKELDLLYKIKIICIDLQNFTREGLEEGYISATINQKPYKQGYETIKMIFNYLLTGELTEYTHAIESEIVIRENLPG